MAWTVVLEDESREILSRLDQEFASSYLTNTPPEGDFKLLKYLDPYGDTVFNNLQMNDLIEDLRVLQGKEVNDLVEEVVTLTKECKAESHTYLVFYGD